MEQLKILLKESEERLRELDSLNQTSATQGRYAELQKVVLRILQLMMTEDSKIEEIKPILVGYLNEKFGFNGCVPNEIGTEVFEDESNYFFYVENIKTGIKNPRKYNKATLKPCIDFILSKTLKFA